MSLQLKSRPLPRRGYPSDVTDEEWAFVVPYLTLCREDAPQRKHDLREVFNAVRWMIRTGAQWRMMPNHFPPWPACYQQTQRWIKAGVFEAMVHDLRCFIRMGEDRAPDPTAVICDARTLQSTPESGHRAGYDGHKRKKGSKLHMVVDTLGMLLTLKVTAANEQERAQVGDLAAEVQALTSGEVEIAFVDQGYTGETPADMAAEMGIQTRGGEAARGQTRLRAPPAPLGGRTQLRSDDALSPSRPGFRAIARDVGGAALSRLRLSHAAQSHQSVPKFITRSRRSQTRGAILARSREVGPVNQPCPTFACERQACVINRCEVHRPVPRSRAVAGEVGRETSTFGRHAVNHDGSRPLVAWAAAAEEKRNASLAEHELMVLREAFLTWLPLTPAIKAPPARWRVARQELVQVSRARRGAGDKEQSETRRRRDEPQHPWHGNGADLEVACRSLPP